MTDIYIADAAQVDMRQELSADDAAEADKYKNEGARRLFIAGRLLLYRAVKERTGSNAAVIKKGPFGKPRIEGDPFFFNISHSGHYAMLVCDPLREAGCDIEQIRGNTRGIARRFFSDGEYKKILRAWDFDDEFCRMWTKKESYIKARGGGLSIPLDSFAISRDMGGRYHVSEKGAPVLCAIADIDTGIAGYHAAVCLMGAGDITGRISFICLH